MVSIHAIATFQALHDYLRPRVAGLLSSSRLSGMFAALAASGFVGSTSKPPEDSSKPAKSADPGAESSAAAASVSTIQRRRSQRLSAKQAGMNTVLVDASMSSSSAAVGASNAPSTLEALLAPVEPTPSDTIMDSELHADFTDDEDDEVDAEVFDDEVDPDTSLSEKTVTVSVVEGVINQDKLMFYLTLLLTYLISKMAQKLRRRPQMALVWQPLIPCQRKVSWQWPEILSLREPLTLLH